MKELIGKTIEKADIDGNGICLEFTNGSMFVYTATDGGYSSWDFYKDKEDFAVDYCEDISDDEDTSELAEKSAEAEDLLLWLDPMLQRKEESEEN